MPDRTQTLSVELAREAVEALKKSDEALEAAQDVAERMENHHRWHHEQEGRPVEGDNEIAGGLMLVAEARADLEPVLAKLCSTLSQPEHQGETVERFRLHPLRNTGYQLVTDPVGEYMRFVDAAKVQSPPGEVEGLRGRVREVAEKGLDRLDRLADEYEVRRCGPFQQSDGKQQFLPASLAIADLRNIVADQRRVLAAVSPSPSDPQGEQGRWKVDDDYPVKATKPDGGEFVFDDLLKEGDEVGLGSIPEDAEDRDPRPPYGRVVRESDGLWIVPDCNPASTQVEGDGPNWLIGPGEGGTRVLDGPDVGENIAVVPEHRLRAAEDVLLGIAAAREPNITEGEVLSAASPAHRLWDRLKLARDYFEGRTVAMVQTSTQPDPGGEEATDPPSQDDALSVPDQSSGGEEDWPGRARKLRHAAREKAAELKEGKQ